MNVLDPVLDFVYPRSLKVSVLGVNLPVGVTGKISTNFCNQAFSVLCLKSPASVSQVFDFTLSSTPSSDLFVTLGLSSGPCDPFVDIQCSLKHLLDSNKPFYEESFLLRKQDCSEIFKEFGEIKLTLKFRGLRKENPHHIYNFERKLGNGNFGLVRLARHKTTQQLFAIKVIEKNKLHKDQFQLLQREIMIISKLNHHSVIRLEEVFDTDKLTYLVLEYASGGTLLNRLLQHGPYTEHESRGIMTQLLEACAYLATQNIAHRDLKPDNILLSETGTIKLTDFGLSKDFTCSPLRSPVGTCNYVAPEVLSGVEYNSACDIWSCGVICYTLLSTQMPFFGRENSQIFEKILACDYCYPDAYFSKVSDAALHFIDQIFVLDPRKRATASDLLHHFWILQIEPVPMEVEHAFRLPDIILEGEKKLKPTPIGHAEKRSAETHSGDGSDSSICSRARPTPSEGHVRVHQSAPEGTERRKFKRAKSTPTTERTRASSDGPKRTRKSAEQHEDKADRKKKSSERISDEARRKAKFSLDSKRGPFPLDSKKESRTEKVDKKSSSPEEPTKNTLETPELRRKSHPAELKRSSEQTKRDKKEEQPKRQSQEHARTSGPKEQRPRDEITKEKKKENTPERSASPRRKKVDPDRDDSKRNGKSDDNLILPKRVSESKKARTKSQENRKDHRFQKKSEVYLSPSSDKIGLQFASSDPTKQRRSVSPERSVVTKYFETLQQLNKGSSSDSDYDKRISPVRSSSRRNSENENRDGPKGPLERLKRFDKKKMKGLVP